MSLPEQIDPEILQDFITESAELLEGLDRDLVTLEQESENLELLNSIFRALHTIKGSSSFLAITPLTEFAHAAEDALNALRKGQVKVTTKTMDYLLAASDVLRRQLEQLQNSQMPDPGPAELIIELKKIGTGNTQDQNDAPVASASPAATDKPDAEQLALSESKLDLLPFMVDDLIESVQNLKDLLEQTETPEDIQIISAQMQEITSGLCRSVDFFEIDTIIKEVHALDAFSKALPKLAGADLNQARARAAALINVLNDRANALKDRRLLNLPTQVLIERLSITLVGKALDQAATLAESADVHDVLALDGVIIEEKQSTEAVKTASQAAETGSSNDSKKGTTSAGGDQTIRVDVARLESLLNLVGELVLQKNRVSGFAKRITQYAVDHDLTEDLAQVASDLDRVTSELQVGVMKTRMQPLNKIFGRYPRLIRDLARATAKDIDLQIIGGETEVDKSVLELLGDPLVHILRNSADHGIESPDERLAAGKPAQGVITIEAGHEGNHVVVKIKDNGRGLDAERIGQKAVERGLVSADELASLPAGNIYRFIFEAGFSTAKQVSDLSGRGVGMDVVKTNITKLNGIVDVDSEQGQGTTVSIRIPLTVAIMQAMMVEVDGELYAIPLTNILEIVKPEDSQVYTINGNPVMRLRDSILPLLDLSEMFRSGKPDEQAPGYAVVVGMGSDMVGLLVHRLIGQEEVVIKPLDKMFDQTNMVSGATVREDGGVSLILDVMAMLKAAQ